MHDITQAEALTAQVRPGAVLADKGYDSDAFLASLQARTITAVIPPKSNRVIHGQGAHLRDLERDALLPSRRSRHRAGACGRIGRMDRPTWDCCRHPQM